MRSKPPHILVTTPESLYILLTAEKSRAHARHVATVIVDEIHAVADDKRGSHLALSLARLDDSSKRTAARRRSASASRRRCGRSKTWRDFLSAARRAGRRRRPPARHGPRGRGTARRAGAGRQQRDVGRDLRSPGRADSARTAPRWCSSTRGAWPSASRFAWPSAWARAWCCRTTEACRASCASRPKRRLKNGRTARGRRDRVARAGHRHRIGRSGRADRLAALDRGRAAARRAGPATGSARRPQGRLFATTRDELIECAALVRAIRAGAMDALMIPDSAARHSRAADRRRVRAATSGASRSCTTLVRSTLPVSRARTQRLRRCRRRCWPTASRPRADAAARSCTAIASTAGCARGAARASRRSPAAARFRKRPTTTWSPSPTGIWSVRSTKTSPSRAWRATSSCSGTTSWRIRRVETGVVRVEDAHGAPPSIPFWNGEALGRTIELSREVAAVRVAIDERRR